MRAGAAGGKSTVYRRRDLTIWPMLGGQEPSSPEESPESSETPATVESTLAQPYTFNGPCSIVISLNGLQAFGSGVIVVLSSVSVTRTAQEVCDLINAKLVEVAGASYSTVATVTQTGRILLTSPILGVTSSITLATTGLINGLAILGFSAGIYVGS